MKYATPELTVVTSAITAIQSESNSGKIHPVGPDGLAWEGSGAYEDWE
jgi:hypothetical protein